MSLSDLNEIVSKANILYHSVIAKTYDESQSHFNLENTERVRNLILTLMDDKTKNLFLDVACGTGFMIDVINADFDYCVGVDITPEMIVEAKNKFCNKNVFLCIGDANNIPFRKSLFNLSSIYCSLHHFSNLELLLTEIYRVIKNNGVFYSDDDPNYYFLRDLEKLGEEIKGVEFISREIEAARSAGVRARKEHGIDMDVTRLSEFQRLTEPGMKKEDVEHNLKRVGFKKTYSEYRWFLGQGHYLHHVSKIISDAIERFLKGCLPLSRNLFKTFYTTAVKVVHET